MGFIQDSFKGATEGLTGVTGTEPFVPNEASPLIVTELTGRKRSVTLRGRALPFRKPTFATSQRSRVTYYNGNPEGTQQIFGPTLDPTTFNGIWRDKYLQPDIETRKSTVEVKGFDQPNTAEQLIALFYDLLRTGGTIEMQWSMYRRIGIVKRFSASPERVEDQAWELEFEWHSDGTKAPKSVAPAGLDVDRMRGAMNALSDLAAFDPIDTLQAFEARIFSTIDTIQGRVDDLLQKARVLQSALTLPQRVVQGVRSSATSIAFLCGQLMQETIESGYTVALGQDGVADVLTMESFRRDMAFLAGVLRDSALGAARNLEARAEPAPVRIVTMDQSGSLRQMAQREYGNADAWNTLADANGFESSYVEPGTEVFIPPAPTQTGVG